MRECINAHTELLKIFENFSHCQKFFAFEKLGNFRLWRFVKKQVLYSKHYDRFDTFRNNIDDYINDLGTRFNS